MKHDGDMDPRRDAGVREEEEDLLGPELRSVLGSLPRELAPERDLRASIAARTWDSRDRIVAPGRTAEPAPSVRHVHAPWWRGQGLKLAAAAAALIVVTSVVTTWIVRQPRNDAATTVVNGPYPGAAAFAEYTDVEAQYASAIADLSAAVEAERVNLPPETVALIEENLRIIDEAIRESMAALRSSPRSLPLQQALVTSYERKLDFLRQAAALTAEG
jgi:hypothetical protein